MTAERLNPTRKTSKLVLLLDKEHTEPHGQFRHGAASGLGTCPARRAHPRTRGQGTRRPESAGRIQRRAPLASADPPRRVHRRLADRLASHPRHPAARSRRVRRLVHRRVGGVVRSDLRRIRATRRNPSRAHAPRRRVHRLRRLVRARRAQHLRDAGGQRARVLASAQAHEVLRPPRRPACPC